MTQVQTNGHDVHAEHAPKPPPRGLRRFTAPGFLRALWMAPLFWGIGAGLVCLLRSFTVWGPVWEWNVIVVVAFLFFSWLVPARTQPAWVANAKSKVVLQSTGDWLMSLLPDDPESTILKRLKRPKPEDADPDAPPARG